MSRKNLPPAKTNKLNALSALAALGGALGAANAWSADGAAKVTKIDFKGTGDQSQIDIAIDGAATAEKQVNAADRQVVILIPGATLSGQAKRSIDTSSFDGEVSLISPYQNTGGATAVKIVIQLRDNVDVAFNQDGGKIHLAVPKTADPNASAAHAANDPNSLPPPDASVTGANGNAPAAPPKTATQDQMDTMLQGIQSKEFTGKPITLQVRDLDVRDVFNLIAETSGFNIVLAPDVAGSITLSLVDVPWDQALDVVMQTMKLGADRKGNILRVMSLEGMAKEIDLQQKVKSASESVEPRKTMVYPISYAKLDDLAAMIAKLIGIEASAGPATSMAGALSGQNNNLNAAAALGQASASPASASTPAAGTVARGNADVKVITDQRTNSLIVWSIASVQERVRKIIETLDTQTPQILLEGKIVEAQESFTRQIGGNIGATNFLQSGNVSYGAGFNNSNLLSSPGGLINNVFSQTGGGPFGGSFATQIIPFGQQINATLSVAESESKLKVLASPRSVVLNKQESTITQSTPVQVPSAGIGPNGAVVNTLQVQNALLSMKVTPTVTGDGSVLLELDLERDIPVGLAGGGSGSQGVAQREIKTHVLVDSGSTLVLGGFFTSSDNLTNSGFPWLREIPILGWLFSTDTKANDRNELFFFITPQVVNPKKAGLQKT